MTESGALVRFARESLGLADGATLDLVPLGGRGSDRAYYRCRWNREHTAILVHYQKSRIENAYFADIASYLNENGIPVPRILRHDPAACLVLMKDLGDRDLWSLRNELWPLKRPFYEKTLRIVHRLHSIPETQFPSGRVRLMDAFGPDLYKWERDYFKSHFLEGLCAMSLDSATSARLEKELSGLAGRLLSGQQSLVHRDLQSQNVMIWENEPFLIDFQGMRFGTRFYDLGSILCDPYVTLSPSERMDLLAFYFGLTGPDLNRDFRVFENAFWEASAQRLMQALGAYGFLGIAKGLKSYLAHVPSGIRNLRTAVENTASLPTLLEICARAESRFTI